jgi:methylmalonyl-CoA/ethylmalonyl-CoA epimerase
MTTPTSPIQPTRICQIAIVVKDIHAAAVHYAALMGVPAPIPRETATADKSHIRYRGQTTSARAKLAFIEAGQVTLELIEPIGAPSVWQEVLEQQGPCVHHLAYRVDDMPAAVAEFEKQGCPCVQSGDFVGGCYAYIDTRPQLGVMTELLWSEKK